MYRPISGSTQGLQDAQRFLRTLETLAGNPLAEARGLFQPGQPIVVARAPGRLDVMGGIADYSGSLVLQLPLRQATFAAVQRHPQREVHVVSLPSSAAGRASCARTPLAALEEHGRPASYQAARAWFGREPRTQWSAYVAGAFLVLMRERGVAFAEGARILIASEVPEGTGVASSAALEVAAMDATAGAFGVALEARELALLCQRVENEVVGAPCGVMDQMTAACGQAGRLLALLCQPAELREPVALPDDLAVFGIDSGIRHAVSGADYGSVRAAAFMGYRILAEAAGLSTHDAPEGRVRVDDPRWGGYLANVDPAEFERDLVAAIPVHLRGADFLARYGGTPDTATRVEPDREYAVRVATAHPIHEHARVRGFAELLAAPAGAERSHLLGQLMFASHASYSACGLGSAGTDRLVELVRQAGPASPLLGAKITGGGSGGTVAVLARRGAQAEEAVERVAALYAAESGQAAAVFSGSSPGAAAFGRIVLG